MSAVSDNESDDVFTDIPLTEEAASSQPREANDKATAEPLVVTSEPEVTENDTPAWTRALQCTTSCLLAAAVTIIVFAALFLSRSTRRSQRDPVVFGAILAAAIFDLLLHIFALIGTARRLWMPAALAAVWNAGKALTLAIALALNADLVDFVTSLEYFSWVLLLCVVFVTMSAVFVFSCSALELRQRDSEGEWSPGLRRSYNSHYTAVTPL